jgi:hypothetical protein
VSCLTTVAAVKVGAMVESINWADLCELAIAGSNRTGHFSHHAGSALRGVISNDGGGMFGWGAANGGKYSHTSVDKINQSSESPELFCCDISRCPRTAYSQGADADSLVPLVP